MSAESTCPGCASDLRGQEIPAESRHYYGPETTHYLRTILHEVPGVYDGGLYWSCPDCGHRWHRWPTTDWRYEAALPFVDGAA